jgi:proteic killer suppression protein
MIRSYRSKALKLFATKGNPSKLPVQNAGRVRRILMMIESAPTPEATNLPGYRFHGLQGQPKRYSLDVSGNYRITFGWDGEDATDVDLEDYH